MTNGNDSNGISQVLKEKKESKLETVLKDLLNKPGNVSYKNDILGLLVRRLNNNEEGGALNPVSALRTASETSLQALKDMTNAFAQNGRLDELPELFYEFGYNWKSDDAKELLDVLASFLDLPESKANSFLEAMAKESPNLLLTEFLVAVSNKYTPDDLYDPEAPLMGNTGLSLSGLTYKVAMARYKDLKTPSGPIIQDGHQDKLDAIDELCKFIEDATSGRYTDKILVIHALERAFIDALKDAGIKNDDREDRVKARNQAAMSIIDFYMSVSEQYHSNIYKSMSVSEQYHSTINFLRDLAAVGMEIDDGKLVKEILEKAAKHGTAKFVAFIGILAQDAPNGTLDTVLDIIIDLGYGKEEEKEDAGIGRGL